MDEYKSLNKYLNKNTLKSDNKFNSFSKKLISKFLISLILFILFLIGNKVSLEFKPKFYNIVYNETFSFAEFKGWYNENFGEVFPLNNLFPNDVKVFNESFVYDSANLYKDGVALKVTNQYLVPLLNSGVVIFLGEKEDYGNTLIVQQENGIDVWYSNINFGDIAMYDYLEKGSYIGEANGDTIYLLFQKDGKFLDYKEYI